MEPITFARLQELGPSGLAQAGEVFVDSYMDALRRLSDDRSLLVGLIGRSLVGERFCAALQDGEVAGIAACSTNRSRALAFDKADLRRCFGPVRGTLYYAFLSGEFHKPLALPDDHGYIEAVATRPSSQGRGVAAGLLRYLCEQTPHRVYSLEVADTNARAIRLYERLGFAVYRTKKQRLYMRLETGK